MANNHQKSVGHAKKIIDDFSELKSKFNLNCGMKLQFRNLDTFIHKDYQSSDLKYVKRFKETELSKEEFAEIVDYIHEKNMISVATPFDNDSVKTFIDLNVQVLKIASCSNDDWPLLEEVSKLDRKIIISTGGATIKHLKKVYNLFKDNSRDFSFLHCVAEYPTSPDKAFLGRIHKLKEEFPDIEIGYSSHESPRMKSVVPFAAAMGASIIEKHIGKETESIKLNEYSCTASDFEKIFEEMNFLDSSIKGDFETSEALQKLKRGIYCKRDIKSGDKASEDDFYFAMPLQDGYSDASFIKSIVNKECLCDMKKDSAVKDSLFKNNDLHKASEILNNELADILSDAQVTISKKDDIELSCHYGFSKFRQVGALIISKINRKYCKKIIAMLPNQSHPEHYHLQKEECFELLRGDCVLNLNGKDVTLKKGEPILINKNVKHSFKTNTGCVIEEVSSTHIPGDSVYTDPLVNSLSLEERKIKL
jgi:N-acetylneuraminate synthase